STDRPLDALLVSGSTKNRGLRGSEGRPSGLEGAELLDTHRRRPLVQITVSVTVELPASGTIDAVERLVVAAGQAAMRAAVQAACGEYERQVAACPACRSDLLQSEGTDARRLRTSVGRVQLAMRRLRCEGGGHRCRPAESFVATQADAAARLLTPAAGAARTERAPPPAPGA